MGSFLARWGESGGRVDSESALSLGPVPPLISHPLPCRGYRPGGGVGCVLLGHYKNCETRCVAAPSPCAAPGPLERYVRSTGSSFRRAVGEYGTVRLCQSRRTRAQRSYSKPIAIPSWERQCLLRVRGWACPWCARSLSVRGPVLLEKHDPSYYAAHPARLAKRYRRHFDSRGARATRWGPPHALRGRRASPSTDGCEESPAIAGAHGTRGCRAQGWCPVGMGRSRRAAR